MGGDKNEYSTTTPITPSGYTPDMVYDEYSSNSQKIGGYTKPAGTINGIQVNAKYDASGNLTGYAPIQGHDVNWLNQNQYITGQWDPSGKATPQTGYQKYGSGGFFQEMAPALGIVGGAFLGAAGGLSGLLGGASGGGLEAAAAAPDFTTAAAGYGGAGYGVGATTGFDAASLASAAGPTAVASGGGVSAGGVGTNAATSGASNIGGNPMASSGIDFSNFNLKDVSSALNIASSINSLTGGGVTSALGIGQPSATGAQAQQMADPFSPYRANLAAMYAGALQPGAQTDITKMPGYSQFESGVMNPALEATKRSMAASGQLQSGNEQIALNKQAQTGYYGFMSDYLNRLATGSGAGAAPSAGATTGLNQAAVNQQGVMQGLGGLAQGLSAFNNSNQLANINYGATGIPQSTFTGSGDASWMSEPWMQ